MADPRPLASAVCKTVILILWLVPLPTALASDVCYTVILILWLNLPYSHLWPVLYAILSSLSYCWSLSLLSWPVVYVKLSTLFYG